MKFLEGDDPQPLTYKRLKKLIMGGSKLQSYFSSFVDHKFTKFGRRVWEGSQFFLTDDILLLFQSKDTCDQVAKLTEIVPKI